MHSRIYQITTAPVEADEYISDCDFCEHWFTRSFADFVDGGIDRSYELTCLRESLEDSGVAVFHDGDSFIILPDGKTAWFRNRHRSFIEAVKKAAAISLEAFMDSGLDTLIIEIKSSFCDEYGPYVSSEEFDTIPLDEFIRECKSGERYYIGGILDYKF